MTIAIIVILIWGALVFFLGLSPRIGILGGMVIGGLCGFLIAQNKIT